MFNNLKNNSQGLTLMETTIALGILMIGVLATVTLLLATFNYAQQSEQEIVVVNLAREGIEIVRAMRNSEDPNKASDVNIFDNSYDNQKFHLDSDDANTVVSMALNSATGANTASACSQCQLYLNDGKYTHTAGQATNFKRMITIEPGDSNKEKKIISEVSWTFKGQTHSYTLETYLTDWQ